MASRVMHKRLEKSFKWSTIQQGKMEWKNDGDNKGTAPAGSSRMACPTMLVQSLQCRLEHHTHRASEQ